MTTKFLLNIKNCFRVAILALFFCVHNERVKKVKGRFMGLFQHCGHSAYCIPTLNKFPHSSPEAPRIIQMRETSTSEGGNYYQ